MAYYRVQATETTTIVREVVVIAATEDDALDAAADMNDRDWTETYSDADVDTVVLPNDPREKGDDDGQEYGDPRDYRDGKE